MINTLANHGFLPHDGRNVTKANAVAALGNGINFDPDLASLMWEQAVIANPQPNATFFTLYVCSATGRTGLHPPNVVF